MRLGYAAITGTGLGSNCRERDNGRVNTKLGSPSPPPAQARSERYRVDLLAALPPASARGLQALGFRRRYRDGQLVQKRGDTASHALVLLSGRFRVLGYTEGGTERMTRWLEAGEITGISSVLGGAPVPVDLVADGDTEVLVLPRQPLLDFLESDARACLAIARLLSLRVNGLLDVVFIGSEDTLQARVWASLQLLAAENGQPLPGGRTLLRLSQSDLSHVVGASRQRVNEELRKLQAAGRVRLGYRWMEVLA